MEVVTTDDEGTLHLGGVNNTLEDTTADGNTGGEWALLVNVNTSRCFLWGSKTKTDVLEVTWSLRVLLVTLDVNVLVQEDGFLLLESTFRLWDIVDIGILMGNFRSRSVAMGVELGLMLLVNDEWRWWGVVGGI